MIINTANITEACVENYDSLVQKNILVHWGNVSASVIVG